MRSWRTARKHKRRLTDPRNVTFRTHLRYRRHLSEIFAAHPSRLSTGNEAWNDMGEWFDDHYRK